MMYIMTIDAGTTNSRIYLINPESNELLDVVKLNVGVKNTAITGSTDTLKKELSSGIKEILERNKATAEDVSFMAAAGMITSNLGLVEVPHLPSPCTLDDFSTASVVKSLPEFFNIPCIFIPGMKNGPHLSSDIMRGEEVETFGLIEQLELKGKGILILPGSHTKYVVVEDNVLQSCLSTISGEMLYAIQKDTILSSSLSKDLVKTTDYEALMEGFHASRNSGLVRALYQVRLLQLFAKMDENQRANFFVGAVLGSDLQAMGTLFEEIEPDWIVVGGSNPLREAFVYLLHYLQYPNVIEASDEQVKMSTIIGAAAIGKMKGGSRDENYWI